MSLLLGALSCRPWCRPWCTGVAHRSGVQEWCTDLVYRSFVQEWCIGVVHRSGAQEWCTGVVHRSRAPEWRIDSQQSWFLPALVPAIVFGIGGCIVGQRLAAVSLANDTAAVSYRYSRQRYSRRIAARRDWRLYRWRADALRCAAALSAAAVTEGVSRGRRGSGEGQWRSAGVLGLGLAGAVACAGMPRR